MRLGKKKMRKLSMTPNLLNASSRVRALYQIEGRMMMNVIREKARTMRVVMMEKLLMKWSLRKDFTDSLSRVKAMTVPNK